jgi:hypothetical protein
MFRPCGAVLLVCVLIHPAAADAQAVTPARARAAFDLLRQLAGEWDASSTQGWQGVRTMQVIAGGSAIVAASRLDPHPGADESMATIFHLDGDRLMLTHYCVARNQPRLVATSISEDGRRIEFSFLDGTNMRSRNDGHMDRAIFTIESPDRYRTRWTFYRDGEERWMEDIVNTRRR